MFGIVCTQRQLHSRIKTKQTRSSVRACECGFINARDSAVNGFLLAAAVVRVYLCVARQINTLEHSILVRLLLTIGSMCSYAVYTRGVCVVVCECVKNFIYSSIHTISCVYRRRIRLQHRRRRFEAMFVCCAFSNRVG